VAQGEALDRDCELWLTEGQERKNEGSFYWLLLGRRYDQYGGCIG